MKTTATMGEMWTQLGSRLASIMCLCAIFQRFFPHYLRDWLERFGGNLASFASPYIYIFFHEFNGNGLRRSQAYTAIEIYLGANSAAEAKRLRADVAKDSSSVTFAIADYEEVTDDFHGARLWWTSSKKPPPAQTISFYSNSNEKRYYKLAFHRRHRDLVVGKYLKHVLEEGKAIAVKNRQRKLYTNSDGDGGYKRNPWSHVVFEHPATFDTLAMEPKKKEEIIKDLINYSKAKDYYAKIGKAWKRGYLLYGPPGTGKSTMIAAMANLLGYNIYDLELTAVSDNTELKKLLIETSSKSIIVIEDIDCSLDLTGQRKKKKKKKEEKDEGGKDPMSKLLGKETESEKDSKVTLSGLLNFIDGLWSGCGGERIIVFTTNDLKKLDPALIRRGRMDKHIELSYCGFEAFMVLAKNYLDVDGHELFGEIRRLLGETEMTPADVAENLMPKSPEEDARSCLERLVEALEKKRKADEAGKRKREAAEIIREEREEKAN
ncbi:AAA-ATPase ASD, mitochondrial-like [Malania oleifera]|uniref:AAA-ATPase ASD, mitochondrial-like n=1 Tax=Malania oleifera TaxID=397392 RepID=UPI0025AE0244|nr:AAA-ATPase ASD, mitochondrial-like [Malania oleifera]